MLSFLQRLRKLFEHRWPAGEPALLENGTRWGTRLSDGTVVLAPGFSFTRLLCSRCQQAIEAERDQAKPDHIKGEA